MLATSSTAARKASSFTFDGLLKPLIFLTYWSDAARISSALTGGSKLKSCLMLRHISWPSTIQTHENLVGRCSEILTSIKV